MSVVFSSILSGNITWDGYFVCLSAALICGVLTALAAAHRSHTTKSFMVTLIVLPMIVETVIVMVNGNVGTGVAVMGAFSLVRFRSVAGKAKDIASIFLSMTSGLACAAGYIGVAILFTALVCLVLMILAHIPLGNERVMDLHITIPETLCFANEFEDLFQKYTKRYRLVKTRTTNMGSLYKLLYRIELRDQTKTQAFIDELRCRNGNLEIMLSEQNGEGDEL